jgi:hypothetical protein
MLPALWLLGLGLRLVWWPLRRYGPARGVALWAAVLLVAVRLHGA